MRITKPPIAEQILTVSALNSTARTLLESQIGQIWVSGEISNLARPSSGHLYFSLKDSQAQVRCALFRQSQRQGQPSLENGQQVLALANVSLYEPRGDYQLIVKHLESAGAGALQLAFNQLKEKLLKEGLFEASHKKSLPPLPQHIGVITSPSGAAIRDILHVLKRRFPLATVIVYPSAVQGAQATGQLHQALLAAEHHGLCDVLIIARGGGSLEDLWPFNDEMLARAIFACPIPVVSGVGHETDFTITDFVADLRAPTPSAAAEAVSPERQELLQQLQYQQRALLKAMQQTLQALQQRCQSLRQRLRHPGERLQQQAQQLDQLEQRLKRIMQHTLGQKQQQLLRWQQQLHSHTPSRQLKQYAQQCLQYQQQLHFAMQQTISRRLQQIQAMARALSAVSPLQTLERGYAILTQEKQRSVIRSVTEVQTGDRVTATLSDGAIKLRVEAIDRGE